MNHSAASSLQAAPPRRSHDLDPQHRLPVLQTDELRVVEPDGTEDPWASADDGVVPDDKPAPRSDPDQRD